MTGDDESALREALYAAIEARDAEALNALVQEHFDEIVGSVAEWARVPAAIRGDQTATSQYVQSVMAIAQVLDAMGISSLLQRLTGADDTNPIVQWNRRTTEAQALSDAGEYEESSQLLLQVLEEIEKASGTAVTNLKPKIFGRLGFNALHQDDYASAIAYMEDALQGTTAVGDEAGIATYYENLSSLRVIHALHAEPERGQRLLALRRLIARAQDAADLGRYHASLELSLQAAAATDSNSGDEVVRALLPKISGLIGFNQYKLGNATEARSHTAAALEQSRAVGDVDGIRIYTANLAALDRRPTGKGV